MGGGQFLLGLSPVGCGEGEMFGGRFSGRTKFISNSMSYHSIANRKWFHSGKPLIFRSQSPIFIHPIEELEEKRRPMCKWMRTTCRPTSEAGTRPAAVSFKTILKNSYRMCTRLFFLGVSTTMPTLSFRLSSDI